MVFRLFISHSSPTRESRERLLALREEIERIARPDTPIRVLVDFDQIAASDEWQRRIAFMLHRCHGGIVLMDEAALSSDWVLAESAFLSLRHRADPRFPFVPVSFLDEPDLVKAAQSRREQRELLSRTTWQIVGFSDVQWAHGQAPADIAETLVSALRARGVLTPHTSPADRLADQLAPLFQGAGQQALRELAEEMDDAPAYDPGGDIAERAALAIVRHMLSCGRLASTLQQMDRLGSAFPSQRRWAILEQLSPLPLPVEGAAVLTQRRPSGGYVHASLRTELPNFTVPLYVRRAHLALRPPKFFAIANTLGSFSDLQENLRSEWRRRLDEGLSDEQVDARLNGPGLDLYVWVPGPVDAAVLDELDRAYPRIAFIIHYPDGGEPTVLPPNVMPVTPALHGDAENAISTDYDSVRFSLTD
jgi:hypothetical protein